MRLQGVASNVFGDWRREPSIVAEPRNDDQEEHQREQGHAEGDYDLPDARLPMPEESTLHRLPSHSGIGDEPENRDRYHDESNTTDGSTIVRVSPFEIPPKPSHQYTGKTHQESDQGHDEDDLVDYLLTYANPSQTRTDETALNPFATRFSLMPEASIVEIDLNITA